MKPLRLLLIIAFFAPLSQGTCTDGKPGTTIVYINGIQNDFGEASLSLAHLAGEVGLRIGAAPLANGCVDFRLGYNDTQGFWADLLEAAQQNYGTTNGFKLFVDIVTGVLPIPDFMKTKLTGYHQTDLRSFDRAQDTQSVIDNIGAIVKDSIGDGPVKNNVIIVSHSQGNLFANDVYRTLRQEGVDGNHMRVVAVATPANETAGGDSSIGSGPHTTLCSDFIYRIDGALEANVPSDPVLCLGASLVFWHHNFVKYYLSPGSESYNAILNNIVTRLGTIETTAVVDGASVSGPVNTSLSLSTPAGPATLPQYSVPTVVPGPPGQYSLTYVSGAPANGSFIGIGPCQTTDPPTASCMQNLSPGQTLTFELGFRTNHVLTLTKSGAGTGTVTSVPAGISCGLSCATQSAPFPASPPVQLTAASGSGSVFGGWGGDCSSAGTNATVTISVTANKSCTATFTQSTTFLFDAVPGTGPIMVTTSSRWQVDLVCPENSCSLFSDAPGGAWAGVIQGFVRAPAGMTYLSSTLPGISISGGYCVTDSDDPYIHDYLLPDLGPTVIAPTAIYLKFYSAKDPLTYLIAGHCPSPGYVPIGRTGGIQTAGTITWTDGHGGFVTDIIQFRDQQP